MPQYIVLLKAKINVRIGVNCFSLQGQIGGMKQYFQRLFNELLINDRDNSYVFFYFRHNTEELNLLQSHRWKENAVLLDSQDQVILHFGKIDLYFCPFGALWPRPVKLPSVVMLPDIQEKYFPQFFTASDLFNRAYYFDPSTHIADQVITISEFTRESIIKHHGIAAEKIHVAHLCAEDDFSNAGPVGDRSGASSLPEEYLFYPANHWFHKNHDNLLQALAILKDRFGLVIQSVFSGQGVQDGYPLAIKVKEYGLQEQVKIVGYLSATDLNLAFKKASILCFPSLFEGFGMPVLEAMSLGCPVVCSGTTSLPEVGGDAALYFDPSSPEDIAEKIRLVWHNRELRDDLAAKGRNQAQLFSARAMADRHLVVFRAAAKSFRIYRYYYNAMVFDPIFRLKMKFTKIKQKAN